LFILINTAYAIYKPTDILLNLDVMNDKTVTCLLVGIPLIVAAALMIFAFADSSTDQDSGILIGALMCSIFIVLGDMFILGFGENVLAGWNTCSEEEKSKYSGKRIFQGSGLMMSVGGIFIFLALMGRSWFPNALFVFIGLMFVWYVAMLIYMNTSETFLSEKGKEEKRSKSQGLTGCG